MKKLIPALIAIALICIVVAVNFGKKVEEKYSYGTDYADLNEYFGNPEADAVPIVLQDARIDETGKVINGVVYFDQDFIEKYLTERFYWDFHENLLLYTNATTTIRSEVGSQEYIENGETVDTGYVISTVKDDTLYIAADYVRKFVNYSYEYYDNPNRCLMMTEWGEKTIAGVNKDTQVRWKAGVKSEILTDIQEGSVVEILEELDDWTKVKTDDAYIGYVPSDTLDEATIITETPVTDVPAEEYTCLTKDEKINLVWHNMEYPQDGASLWSTCAYIKSVNVISPTWFWLTDNEGNFESVAHETYADQAIRMGMETWPVIQNFHTGTDVDLEEVLSYTSKRETLINNLIEQVVQYGGTGINVDFENVPSSCASHYLQFIRELSLAAHAKGLIVSVDDYVPSDYTFHYNRKEQGLFADYIIIMAYDEHYAGSEIGSVSSIPWMKQGIEDTIAEVDSKKVINAIPFYTRVWITTDGVTTSEAVDMSTAKSFLKKHGITTTYDETTCQNYGEAVEGTTKYQVWMEDADSVRIRLNVMSNYDIAGLAAWRLGEETRDVWDVIESYMAQ